MQDSIKIDDELNLRFLKPDDAKVIFEILQEDPYIRHYVGLFSECSSEELVRAKIQDQMEHGALRYGIEKDGDLIGYIGIWQDPDVTELVQYNISYFLSRGHRGDGIVTKAVQKILVESEEHLEVDRFSALIEEGNEASAAILANLGFVSKDEPQENSHGKVSWEYVREVSTK